MKIKGDFVTNSSSSSFVVMGATIANDAFPQEVIDRLTEKYPNDSFEDMIGSYEFGEVLVENTDLSFSYGYEYEGELMIGITYTDMDDNETLGQFKERVKQQIKEASGIDTEVFHIEESWMDS